MLYNILLIVQIVVSITMIALILMQHGKGADAGAAFGSGASGTVFGSRGAGNFLSRTTAVLATIFFANSLGLAYLVSHRSDENSTSVINSAPTVKKDATPADVPQANETESSNTSDVPSAPADVPKSDK